MRQQSRKVGAFFPGRRPMFNKTMLLVGLVSACLVVSAYGSPMVMEYETGLELYEPTTDLAVWSLETDLATRATSGMKYFFDVGMSLEGIGATAAFGALVSACFYAASLPPVAAGCLFIALGGAVAFISLGYRAGKMRHGGAATIGDGQSTQVKFKDRNIHIAKHGIAKGFAPHHKHHKADTINTDDFMDIFGTTVRHHGWVHRNSSINGHLIPDGYDSWPVHEYNDRDGNIFHQLTVDTGDELHLRMWHADPAMGLAEENAAAAKKKKKQPDLYNKEYFHHGGLDAIICKKETKKNQLHQMDVKGFASQIQCKLKGEMNKKNVLYVAPLDTDGTGGVKPGTSYGSPGYGTIAVVGKDGQSVIGRAKKCPHLEPSHFHKCTKVHTSG